MHTAWRSGPTGRQGKARGEGAGRWYGSLRGPRLGRKRGGLEGLRERGEEEAEVRAAARRPTEGQALGQRFPTLMRSVLAETLRGRSR